MRFRQRTTEERTEAREAAAHLAQATADLESLTAEEPFEEQDDDRDWTGAPTPGSVRPVADEYEAALTLDARFLTRHRELKTQIYYAGRKLERRRERVKHAGDEARPAALRNLEAHERELDALQRKLWEQDDDREHDAYTCPRCERELQDAHHAQIHRVDCRRTRRDD